MKSINQSFLYPLLKHPEKKKYGAPENRVTQEACEYSFYTYFCEYSTMKPSKQILVLRKSQFWGKILGPIKAFRKA
jgi:hypothetical protein